MLRILCKKTSSANLDGWDYFLFGDKLQRARTHALYWVHLFSSQKALKSLASLSERYKLIIFPKNHIQTRKEEKIAKTHHPTR